MTKILRRQDGFTLIEVLLVMSLLLIITGATLGTFTAFERNAHRNTEFNDDVEEARRGLDVLSRQLRNLAKRYYKDQLVITRAEPTDFVFQTSDPTRKWMRYCLDTSDPKAGVLWKLESAADLPSYMTTSACSPAVWPADAAAPVADHVVNQYPTTYPQPIFSYGCRDATVTTCSASSIKSVAAVLDIDQDVDRRPVGRRVATAVYLRNQNEPPVARFTPRPNPLTHQVFLNGSESSDPEGRTLRFFWFQGTRPVFTCDAPPPASQILSREVTYAHTFKPGDPPLVVSLVVCDPGDLQSIADYQTIAPV